ncbi:MAG TPA: hypothetical protein VNG90_00080 [Candidatus Acidoferrum sp.]|nr:hypothetical protein [Candidatus Acidoferrum sp.]
MLTQFDAAMWHKAFGKPDWYLDIIGQFKELEAAAAVEPDYEKRKAIKGPMYQAVETALREGQLQLATSGEDNDAARKPIDMVVIHHMKIKPGITLDQLNAKQLLRLYGVYYANPTYPADAHIKGEPVWSGQAGVLGISLVGAGRWVCRAHSGG